MLNRCLIHRERDFARDVVSGNPSSFPAKSFPEFEIHVEQQIGDPFIQRASNRVLHERPCRCRLGVDSQQPQPICGRGKGET